MPAYDFRCKQCGEEFELFYKSYKAYDQATPTCPHCAATDLSRIINRVNVQAPTRDFSSMNSNEMLSVLESGDSKQVGQMFQQIGGTSPELGARYHETTERLLKGESMEKVEKGLQEQDAAQKANRKTPPPPDA